MRIRCAAALAVALVVACATPALAASFTINVDTVLSGTAPSGPAPWLTFTVEDQGPDTVKLTFATVGLTGNENVGQLGFNLNPALNPTLVNFAYFGGVAATSISKGADAFKQDGQNFSDFEFQYPNAPPASRFLGGLTSVYVATLPSLDALDFLFYDSGDKPLQYLVAHYRSIGPKDESGWSGGDDPPNPFTPVPEPTTLALLGFGLAAGVRRMRKR